MAAPTFIQELRKHRSVVESQGLVMPSLAAPDYTEHWHFVGETNEIGFENGWTNVSQGAGHPNNGWNHTSYRRDESGFVHLRGMAMASPVLGRSIFTLPADYAPPRLTVLTCGMNVTNSDISSSGEVAPVYVHADGTVEMIWTEGSGHAVNYLMLDNHRWRAW